LPYSLSIFLISEYLFFYFESKNSFENKSIKPGHSGTGLDNLKKRLELIYPERHQLEIEKTESYFKVILHLQL
jgi:LytS/YehU family sensor histidine kinase